MLRLSIIGHVGSDAILRDVGNGQTVVSFSVAHTEKYKTKTGEEKETTTWVNCSYFRETGRTGIAQYLTKGTLVFVEGAPSSRAYQNKEGQTVASLELKVTNVQLLGGGKSEGKADQPTQYPQPEQPPLNDDVPF